MQSRKLGIRFHRCDEPHEMQSPQQVTDQQLQGAESHESANRREAWRDPNHRSAARRILPWTGRLPVIEFPSAAAVVDIPHVRVQTLGSDCRERFVTRDMQFDGRALLCQADFVDAHVRQ